MAHCELTPLLGNYTMAAPNLIWNYEIDHTMKSAERAKYIVRNPNTQRCFAMAEIRELLGSWQLDVKVVRDFLFGAPTARERERWHAM
jgi:hypothetical protein